MASESLDIGDKSDNKVNLIKNHCKFPSGIKLKIKLMPLPYESGHTAYYYTLICVYWVLKQPRRMVQFRVDGRGPIRV